MPPALLPRSEDELYQLSLLLCVGYLACAYLIWGVRWYVGSGRVAPFSHMTRTFDAVTFATSILALASIFDRQVLLLLGNLKPFLILAGLCGTGYSLHALLKA